MVKKTQTDIVVDLFKENKNQPMHYQDIADKTGIIVHNVRRITGQNVEGKVPNPVFERVQPGVYKLANKETDNPEDEPLQKVSNENMVKKKIEDFSDLLINNDIEPSTVQLVKHKRDIQDGMDDTYYWLWKTDKKRYDYESSTQKKDRFDDRKYLATFVVTPFNETLFASFYNIGKQNEDGAYKLESNDTLIDFEGNLIIDWGLSRNIYQIAGNSEKKILEDGSINSLDELVPGKEYIRRKLHDSFGGNRRKGIVNLPKHNAIFLMPAFINWAKLEDIGYEASWNNGIYHLSGEGLYGDQKMSGANKKLAESKDDGTPIYLFEPLEKSKPYTHKFHSQLICTKYKEYYDTDLDNNRRKMYRFYFKSASHPEYQNTVYKKVADEIQEDIEEKIIKDYNKKLSFSEKRIELSQKEFSNEIKTAEKRTFKERKLQTKYIDFLKSKGYDAGSSPNVDIIAKKNGEKIFIEAKILSTATTAAHGLGQLLHYNFIAENKADHLELLFDKRPNKLTAEFIMQFNVKITYQEEDNFITI